MSEDFPPIRVSLKDAKRWPHNRTSHVSRIVPQRTSPVAPPRGSKGVTPQQWEALRARARAMRSREDA